VGVCLSFQRDGKEGGRDVNNCALLQSKEIGGGYSPKMQIRVHQNKKGNRPITSQMPKEASVQGNTKAHHLIAIVVGLDLAQVLQFVFNYMFN
jgi:hypothetical protein